MTHENIPSNLLQPLSEEELQKLDSFLSSGATSDETMMLDALDGYLTAIIIGPTSLKFDQWFSGIWGPNKEHMPAFETKEEATHIFNLIIRRMNGIIAELENDPDGILPVFGTRIYAGNDYEYTDGEMWAYGFMDGVMLTRKDWQPLFDDPNGREALRPIYLLGEDDITEEEMTLTDTPEQREELTIRIPASISWIYQFWLPYRHAMVERTLASVAQKSSPKVGRNDPCPCGSGKKFKKCCGAASLLH